MASWQFLLVRKRCPTNMSSPLAERENHSVSDIGCTLGYGKFPIKIVHELVGPDTEWLSYFLIAEHRSGWTALPSERKSPRRQVDKSQNTHGTLYEECILKFVHRYNKCLTVHSVYVECYLGLNLTPCYKTILLLALVFILRFKK